MCLGCACPLLQETFTRDSMSVDLLQRLSCSLEDGGDYETAVKAAIAFSACKEAHKTWGDHVVRVPRDLLILSLLLGFVVVGCTPHIPG